MFLSKEPSVKYVFVNIFLSCHQLQCKNKNEEPCLKTILLLFFVTKKVGAPLRRFYIVN